MGLGASLQTQWVGISGTLPCPWYSTPQQTNKIHSYSYNVKYVKRTLNYILELNTTDYTGLQDQTINVAILDYVLSRHKLLV